MMYAVVVRGSRRDERERSGKYMVRKRQKRRFCQYAHHNNSYGHKRVMVIRRKRDPPSFSLII